MDNKPTILQVIDHIGAWIVLALNEWNGGDWVDREGLSPVATARNVITGDVEIPVEYEAKETWEDEIE